MATNLPGNGQPQYQQMPMAQQAPPAGQPSSPGAVDGFSAMQQYFTQPSAPATGTPQQGVDAPNVFYIGGNGGVPQQQQAVQQPGVASPVTPQQYPVQQPYAQQPAQQPAINNPLINAVQQFQQTMPQQQTLDYNQLFNQPVQQADPVAEYIKTNNELLQRLVEQQSNNNRPVDYLSMDNERLLELINGTEDGASKLKDVLQSVKQQAVSEATKEYEKLNGTVEAMKRQHNTIQAQYAVSRLREKYGGYDPAFEHNLIETSKYLATSGTIQEGSDVNAIVENAYMVTLAKRMADPNYLQALAAQASQTQQTVNTNRMQQVGNAGVPPVTQNVAPFPMQTTAPAQPRNDAAFTADILRFGGNTLPTLAFTV